MKRYEFTVGGMRESLDGAWMRYDEASAKISKTLDLFARSEIERDKHLAAIKELTDRLAQVERERDELKRGKSCEGCKWHNLEGGYGGCELRGISIDEWDHEKNEPRDPSAEQGELK